MKWIVGLDLRTSSHGALRFGAWLFEHGQGQTLEAMHAMEGVDDVEESKRQEIQAAAEQATQRAIERCGVTTQVESIHVAHAEDPERAIESVFRAREATGIIVGREGASTEDPQDRLGQVSRRLLRRLPGPVIVTRPELTASELRPGSIIVCADLDGDATPALCFARRLGDALGREVVVAHVIRKVFEQPIIYMQDKDWAPRKTTAEAEAQEKLEKWLASEGAPGLRVCLDEGPVLRRLLGIAATEEALMIVCGARNISQGPQPEGRAFLSSSGADLAAISRIPVAVVPSDYE